jgi:hypothetical protein
MQQIFNHLHDASQGVLVPPIFCAGFWLHSPLVQPPSVDQKLIRTRYQTQGMERSRKASCKSKHHPMVGGLTEPEFTLLDRLHG